MNPFPCVVLPHGIMALVGNENLQRVPLGLNFGCCIVEQSKPE